MKHKSILACILICLSLSLLATRQIPEKITYENNEYRLPLTPLEDYFSGEIKRPEWLQWTSTACYRGYRGTWTISDNSLYVLRLRRKENTGEEENYRFVEKDILPQIFPASNGPVKAAWFSGVIAFALHSDSQLENISTIHFGFRATRIMYIAIVDGEVIGKRLINTEAPSSDPPDRSWQELYEKTGSIHSTARSNRDAAQSKKCTWFNASDLRMKAYQLKESGKEPVQDKVTIRGLFFGKNKLWGPPMPDRPACTYREKLPGKHTIPKGGTPVEITVDLYDENGVYNVLEIKELEQGAPIQAY